ncbi:MAG TPA: hypothetical protein VMV46_17825, partial [Thermoanaerobaculia bacterium]|nr:hypothetical protein [Thermoanaerobaculia bacterium]
RGAAPAPEAARALDDVPYLPPPAPGERALRDELAAAAVEAGLGPVVQLVWGEPAPALPAGACRLLIDALPALLGVEAPPPPPAGEGAEGLEVVWLVPVLPDLDGEELARLEELGARRFHVYEPRLTGGELRRLAETARRPLDFDAWFHGDPVDGTALMRAARRAGLRVLHPRPPGPPGGGEERRRLAGVLAQTADLWLRAGRPAEEGQGLFRASRELDRTPFDLPALARDGNLKVLDWLEGPAGPLVESWLARREAPLLEELIVEVLGST